MKILPAVVLCLVCLFAGFTCLAQADTQDNLSVPQTELQDTIIAKDPLFKIRALPIPEDEMQDTIIRRNPRFIVREAPIPAYEMQDTVIARDALFAVEENYKVSDSLEQARKDAALGHRNPLAVALGNSLMRAAEMQDTVVFTDPAFIVSENYSRKDSLDAVQEDIHAAVLASAKMQDTVVIIDPAFIIHDVYAKQDLQESVRDSISTKLAEAAVMQDTVVILDPSFQIVSRYANLDAAEAILELLARPTIMQDTVIEKDPAFVITDLYSIKDSLDIIKDSLKVIQDSLVALADSMYTDSVNRHWARWKKYQIEPDHSFALNTKAILKGKTKAELQYNIADFYLFLNGEPVRPADSDLNFFAAGCLGFKYDDTLLLNSGLGFKVGVGVGIKILNERFTSSLHVNKHNARVFRHSSEDSVYQTSIIAEPATQSLILQYSPANTSNNVITGEYQATYNKFYEKNDDDRDEVRSYTVRIIFRCRVTGGINSIK